MTTDKYAPACADLADTLFGHGDGLMKLVAGSFDGSSCSSCQRYVPNRSITNAHLQESERTGEERRYGAVVFRENGCIFTQCEVFVCVRAYIFRYDDNDDGRKTNDKRILISLPLYACRCW